MRWDLFRYTLKVYKHSVKFKFIGHLENFEKPFENAETHLGKLSVAFYSGIFSYAGWYT